jgi:hypothetical protein
MPDPQVTSMGLSREIPEETPNTPYCYCLANFSEFMYMYNISVRKYSISQRSEMLNYQYSSSSSASRICTLEKFLLSFLPRTQQITCF